MSQPAEKHQELDPVKEPWTRMEGETAKAYQAFCLFRDLGPTRSHRLVAEVLVEEAPERKVETVISQLKGWSVKYRWVARAETYDEYRERRCREQAETEMDLMQRRYRDLAAGVSSLMAQRLWPNPPEGVNPLDVNDFSAPEFVRAMDRLQIVEDRSSSSSSRSLVHLNCISRHEFERFAESLYDGLMFFIPEERQPRAAQWVAAFFEGKA